ncbi:nucleoid-associated protein [Pseudomonas abieticivorans]|uniref:nucleoid-associated protein n=1 Tax=Pseudomonas abieticivorans TaxID=2931382 RepID=UPI0020BF6298|nr:nucleoid-associated protein [Pseudomonas sp. PIA16]
MSVEEPMAGEVVVEDEIRKVNVIVKSAITAGFERDKSITDFPFVSSLGAIWDNSDTTAQMFVEKIEEKFRKKGKLHGVFDSTSIHKTAEHLYNYIGSADFTVLVKLLCKSLERTGNLPERKGLVGGNIVFIHYSTVEADDQGRILIVMLGNQSGFEFDMNLQPKSLTSINISELKQAAFFDLNLFSIVYPELGREAYLRFIQAGSKSAFFQEALGCKQSVTNRDSAENIISAVREFAKKNAIPLSVRDKIETSITDLFSAKSKSENDKIIKLVEIQSLVDKELPLDSPLKNKYSTFVNANEYMVNDFFEVTSRTVNTLLEVEVRDNSRNYVCRVKSSSIGVAGSDKPITVDENFQFLRVPLDEVSRSRLMELLGVDYD